MRLMDISTYQLCWFFIAAKLLRQINGSKLFLRWMSSYGLQAYRMPTDDELRKLQYSKKQGKKDSKTTQKGPRPQATEQTLRTNEFAIHASDLVKLNLDKVNLSLNTMDSYPHGETLEWLVDFAAMSLISLLLTQALISSAGSKSNELNLSLVWIFIVVLSTLASIFKSLSLYFDIKKSPASAAERIIIMVSAISQLLLVLLILTVGEAHLALKVDESVQLLNRHFYQSTLPNRDALLDPDQIEKLPIKSIGSFSVFCIKLALAVNCAIVGASLTFPGFKFGQMHENVLSDPTLTRIERIFCNINLVSPFLVVCLWIPKISYNVIKQQDLIPVDEHRFELFRAYAAVLTNVIRFLSVRRYMKVNLSAEVESRLTTMRRLGGLTSNKQIQSTIGRVGMSINVTCKQYLQPAILCLFTSILLASFTHLGIHNNDQLAAKAIPSLRYLFGDDQNGYVERVEDVIFKVKSLASSSILKNVLGFYTWSFHFAMLCTTVVGSAYYKYF